MLVASLPTVTILDHLLEGCQIIDAQWRYQYLNNAALVHAQRSRDEMLGRTMMEMYPGIEHSPMFEVLRECMTARTRATLEHEFTYSNGSTAWFELRAEPVPEGLFVLSLDISARKQSEKKIHEQLQRLQSLRAIDLAILGTTDVRVALQSVLYETVQRLSAPIAAVFLTKPAPAELVLVAGLGTGLADLKRTTIPFNRGILGCAVVERRTVVLSDVAGQLRDVASLLAVENVRSACATPFIAKGRVIGVLLVAFRDAFEPDVDWLNFLEVLAGQAAMTVDAGQTFEHLQRSHVDLALAYDATIEGWSNALDLRDWGTAHHTVRVAEVTVALARRAGFTDEELVHVRRGALLHDIGKIAVPDSILFKRGKLSAREWAIMRQHPTHAYERLAPIEYLRPALDIPWCHHERWDGTGYPRGLRGEAIPLAARLFAVVDVWDALRSDRPYRKGWPEQRVRKHLQAIAGTHLDPEAVDLFMRMATETDSDVIRTARPAPSSYPATSATPPSSSGP